MRKTTSYSCHLFASILVALLPALLLTACIRETEYGMPETTYISVKISPNNARTDSRADQKEGDPLDNEVKTLRIMAFSGGSLAENHYFNNVSNGQVVEFSIIVGNYDLVFIANEPGSLESELSNLITSLTDLEAVAFPASAFDSHLPIPMLQKINNVTIAENGKAILHDGTTDIHGHEGRYNDDTTTDLIELGLDRLGARVDITLNSNRDLTSSTSISLSNLPDVVPLFASAYGDVGHSTARVGISAIYVRGEYKDDAINMWQYDATRIIIPANNDISKPVGLKFPDIDKSIKLQITKDNYALPYNSWLDVTVTYKETGGADTRNGGKDNSVEAEELMKTNITVRNW